MRTVTLAPAALLAAGLLLAGCQRHDRDDLCQHPTDAATQLSRAQLDETIWQKLRADGKFEWASASDQFVWSALAQSDYVLAVGYRPESFAKGAPLPDNPAQRPEWQAARQQVLDVVLEEERKAQPNLKAEDLVVFEEHVLPVLDVRVKQLSTVQRLRQLGLVRYADPMGYQPADGGRGTDSSLLSSGCGANVADNSLVAGADYQTLTAGGSTVKSGWNQADPYHGIRSAWSQSSGAGIKLLVIDSGCSFAQDNLGSQFNQGLSSGRTIERLVTLPRATFLGIPTGPTETPDDDCGHGTSMASTAAAPRGTDGAAVGIAYNASAVTVHAAADVFINESREVKGVADAFALAGNRPDVRIVSLSLGTLIGNSQMTDAIQYAYQRGKLIFCAAGTSFSWSAGWVGVIYPASLAEAVAVTGVKDNLTQRCDLCHEGPKVEFTVVMERTANGKHGLCLALSGDQPSTVGGSSVATSSMAGMAALVWSRYPAESAAQIKARLVAAASGRNNRSSTLGYGRVNVGAAVGALPL